MSGLQTLKGDAKRNVDGTPAENFRVVLRRECPLFCPLLMGRVRRALRLIISAQSCPHVLVAKSRIFLGKFETKNLSDNSVVSYRKPRQLIQAFGNLRSRRAKTFGP
jgi:hypothetical protein